MADKANRFHFRSQNSERIGYSTLLRLNFLFPFLGHRIEWLEFNGFYGNSFTLLELWYLEVMSIIREPWWLEPYFCFDHRFWSCDMRLKTVIVKQRQTSSMVSCIVLYCIVSTHVPITPKRKLKTPLSEIFFLSLIIYKYSKNPWGQIILMKFLSIHPREVFYKKSWVVVFFCF